MEIRLMNTANDPRTVNKNAEIVAITQCEPFGSLDIDNPIIRIKPFTGFAVANCFYIPDLGRYYSINKTVRLSGNIIEIHGTIDVLWTYANVILQSTAVCVANEYIGATHIADKNYPLDIRKNTTVYEFRGDPFNTETATDYTYNFILNVAGGENIEQ